MQCNRCSARWHQTCRGTNTWTIIVLITGLDKDFMRVSSRVIKNEHCSYCPEYFDSTRPRCNLSSRWVDIVRCNVIFRTRDFQLWVCSGMDKGRIDHKCMFLIILFIMSYESGDISNFSDICILFLRTRNEISSKQSSLHVVRIFKILSFISIF